MEIVLLAIVLIASFAAFDYSRKKRSKRPGENG
jgi:hypothetical protein